MIQEVLTLDRSESRKINHMSSEIEKKLTLQNLHKVECRNNHLGKRVIKLESDNDDCHRYVGELLPENDAL